MTNAERVERLTLVVAGILFLSASLFPPWRATSQIPGTAQAGTPIGYRFLFASAPVPRERRLRTEQVGVEIDGGRLVVDYVALLALAGVLAVLEILARRRPYTQVGDRPWNL
jgi:hypothetical protein